MTRNQNNNFYEILAYLPYGVKSVLENLPLRTITDITEIRLRAGRPLSLTVKGENVFVSNRGNICFLFQHGLYIVSDDDVREAFKRMCEHSVYAHTEELKSGFITLKNGCRAGLAATAVYDNGIITGFKSISSINIRIAGEYLDCALQICDKFEGGLIIAGPPSSGKTTLLRDAVRLMSNGRACKQKRVALIDSRDEIASVKDGVPQYDVGNLTDVISGCSKSDGIEVALRTLNPNVIAFDEITTVKEADEVISGFFAGADVITTVHAGSIDELARRKAAMRLIESGVVKNAVFINGIGETPIVIDLEKVLQRKITDNA